MEKTGNTDDGISLPWHLFRPGGRCVHPHGQRGNGRCRSRRATSRSRHRYTGADSFVKAGAFATCGVSYTELGTYTAARGGYPAKRHGA